MAGKKLIMFDFDGVLVNTLAMAYGINTEVDKELTLPQYRALFNGNIAQMVKKTGFTGNPDFYRRYAEEARTITVPAEMKDLVRLFAKNYTLSIVSGSPTSAIREILQNENIIECFSDVLGYDVDESKVVRIKMLLSQYAVDPKETVFITDTAGDVFEAAECSVRSIAVTWGYQDKETLSRAEPMVFADSATELTAAVEEFFSGTM